METTLRQNKLVQYCIAVLVFAGVLSLLHSTSASAALTDNSRLNYGNAWNYCHTNNGSGPYYFAKGMVWISNQTDYYSEAVTVSEGANSVRVSIRGALNACETTWGSDRDIYAVDLSTSYLSGLSSTELYRGRIAAAGNYRWSSQGSRLYGDFDISRVARCTTESLATGSVSQTVYIDITRRQQQRYTDGSVSYNSYVYGTESVPVNVTRSCPSYDYDLTPSITSFTDQAALETPQSSLAVSGSVSNAGPTQSQADPSWRITQLVYRNTYTIPASYKSGVTTSTDTTDACAHFAGELTCSVSSSDTRSVYPVGTTSGHNATANVSDYEVGTQVCFVLSVRPYNHSQDHWKHSAMRCYRVGVKPKVTVIGGDLFVGRKPNGYTGSTTGRVVTSRSQNPTGTYGSWVEYAIAPTGPVTYAASGSNYVGGNPLYPNILTFANQGHTAASCVTTIGCYAHNSGLPNVAGRFPVTSSSPNYTGGSLNGLNNTYRSSAASLSIPASSISPGRSIIINAPDTNVTITGNIINNSGTMSDLSQIAQVVIIAQNITIDEDVTRVDAWLISPGKVNPAGTAVTDGVIRTCDVATGSLNSGVCDDRLVVNGPVIAHRLVMVRTGQVGTGADAGSPAEVFNFRPDAYLWALQHAEAAGRVTTVSTKELPPRY